MIEDTGAEFAVPLPNVTGVTLSKVLEYCNKHRSGDPALLIRASTSNVFRLTSDPLSAVITRSSSTKQQMTMQKELWKRLSTSGTRISLTWTRLCCTLSLLLQTTSISKTCCECTTIAFNKSAAVLLSYSTGSMLYLCLVCAADNCAVRLWQTSLKAKHQKRSEHISISRMTSHLKKRRR